MLNQAKKVVRCDGTAVRSFGATHRRLLPIVAVALLGSAGCKGRESAPEGPKVIPECETYAKSIERCFSATKAAQRVREVNEVGTRRPEEIERLAAKCRSEDTLLSRTCK